MKLSDIAKRVKAASEVFLAGRAPGPQYAMYLIKNAELLKKSMPGANPDYRPMHADEDPEALARLDSVGLDEVPDEDLNERAEFEAEENIGFQGGLWDD